MTSVEKALEAVEKTNRAAADILRKFIKNRAFGLVYESREPEAARLWKKQVRAGDKVHVLPLRGAKEGPENTVIWTVKSIGAGMAALERRDEDGVAVQDVAPAGDLVAVAEWRDPLFPGLKELGRVERGGPDAPFHAVISAENYHALKLLEHVCPGRVDCIYIDPPYNKPNSKDWKYNCNYVGAEDRYKHSKWLAFMERRLRLAKRLLNPEDSVLIATIDEVEYARLGLLLEQIFPEAKIQMISSVINPSGVARGAEFFRTDEYLYVVRLGACRPEKLRLPEDWLTARSTGKDRLYWRPVRRGGSHDTRAERPNLFYPIYASLDGARIIGAGTALPSGARREDFRTPEGCIAIWPLKPNGKEGCWQISQACLEELRGKGYVKLTSGRNGACTPWYLAKGEREKVEKGQFPVLGRDAGGAIVTDEAVEEAPFIPGTQWRVFSHSAREYGAGMLRRVFKDKVFDYPKSLYAVHDVLRFFLAGKPDALVVDFFAGSGTTLHAVNLLNAQDGGRRRCICATNNEVSAGEAERLAAQGFRPSDPEWERLGIACGVTWPRTKCFIEGVDVEGSPLNGSYGCETDAWSECEADMLDPDTGKKMRGTFGRKTKRALYPGMEGMTMAGGFRANAVFFELTCESPAAVRLGLDFDALAPVFWLQAGGRGPVIYRNEGGRGPAVGENGRSWAATDFYGVLFNQDCIGEFCREAEGSPKFRTAFVVSEDDAVYADICGRLPGVDVRRLYVPYLRHFERAGEGAE
ncbi:MAG: hypothetical protein K6E40_02985 [Desulfovibrio sp.]|nr:hypothetical protein [Desulfovibrio sp.]